MDQVKIGKFIAQRRKLQNLTQLQLAEKLDITDRAVSKWETGKALPDTSLMLELCQILGITVTDLLSGEVITMEHYSEEMEKKLLELAGEKEAADKRLLQLEWVVGGLAALILFVPIIIAAYAPLEEWLRVVIAFSGFIPAVVGFIYAMRIEQTAGYYHCGSCGHKYVPESKAMYMAPHMGRTRYMRCPQCGEKTWQKKVLQKDN